MCSAAGLLVWAVGCLSAVDLTPTGYTCQSDSECGGQRCILGVCREVPDAGPPTTELEVPLYRLRIATGEAERLVADPVEYVLLTADGGYVLQEVPCRVATRPSSSTVAVHELQRPSIGDWLYTSNSVERDKAVANYGYTAEGAPFYGAPVPGDGGVGVYRMTRNGYHRYPSEAAERDRLVSEGWVVEFIVFGGRTP